MQEGKAMERRFKWIISGIMALGIGGYFVYSSIKPLETELLTVKAATISQTFKEEGIVTAAVERPVYSLVSGRINNLPIKEGDTLKKGDLLAKIEAEDLEYQLQQLKAQKKSLQGQEKMTDKDIEQQLGQLKGQLESIIGQEKQANKSPYAAQIQQQQLLIADIKRQLGIAKQDFNKINVLYGSGAVSKKELDDARNKVEQLENNLLQQEQALKLIKQQAEPLPGTDQYFSGLKNAIQTQITILQKELDQSGMTGTNEYYQGSIESVDAQISHLNYLLANSKIASPINGVVKELSVKEGAMITSQSPLLTLTSADNFEVEVYLLTEDVLNVTEGMEVQLIQKRKNGDYAFSGKVTAIAPAAEEKISALGLTEQKVKVTITPNQQGAPQLRPGYALDVVFTTLVQNNKLAVPKVVLFPYEDGDALWVVKGGKAVLQKVEKGMETDELVVIEKGIKAGDKVIKNPLLEGLEAGKAVE